METFLASVLLVTDDVSWTSSDRRPSRRILSRRRSQLRSARSSRSWAHDQVSYRIKVMIVRGRGDLIGELTWGTVVPPHVTSAFSFSLSSAEFPKIN